MLSPRISVLAGFSCRVPFQSRRSTVDLAIEVSHVTFLSARGKVVRVEAKIAGNSSVAIAFKSLSVA